MSLWRGGRNWRGAVIFIWLGSNGFAGRAFPKADSASAEGPAFFWGEFYNESASMQTGRDNFIALSHIRQGVQKQISSSLFLDGYLLLRYGKDRRRDFWNNRFEWGPGLRLRFADKLLLAGYMEFIRGSYLNDPGEDAETPGKRYDDFRTGLIFWYGWDRYQDPAMQVSFPADFWGEAYADVSYYRMERKNTIGYAHVKTGIHAMRFWKTTLDVFGVAYLNKDVKRDFWNNKAEFGPSVWIKPWEGFDLEFYMEWLNGYYYGIESIDPNPYAQRYRDRRMGILLWIGW